MCTVRKTRVRYIFGKFDRAIAVIQSSIFDEWGFRWTVTRLYLHRYRASNRSTKGENPLYRTIWYLTHAANTRRLLLRLRLSAAWESADERAFAIARATTGARMGGRVGARKIASRKATGRPCRVTIGCHVSQNQQKKNTRSSVRSTSEWVKFDVR